MEYTLFNNWTLLDFSSLANISIIVGDYCFAIYLLNFSFARSPNLDMTGGFWQYLLQANRELGNSDGFQGVVASLDTKNIELYSLIEEKNCHEKNWLPLWSMQDSILQGSAGVSNALLRQSLSSSGHFTTLAAMLEPQTGKQNTNEYYESLWRLGKWTLHDAFDDFSLAENDNLHQLDRRLYNCLERFENSSSVSSLQNMIDEHLVNFRSLKGNNLALVPFLEIKEAITSNSSVSSSLLLNSAPPLKLKDLLSVWNWRLQEILTVESFQDIEKILAVRTRILISMHQQGHCGTEAESLSKFLADHLFSLAHLALAEKNILLARSSVLQFQTLFQNEISEIQKMRMDVLLQKIEWERGEETVAMKFFKQSMDSAGAMTGIDKSFKAELFHNYGQWLIQSRKSTPIQIIEEYLEPASSLDPSVGLYCYDLAKYADSVYTDMLNDDNFRRSERLLVQREKELALLKKEPPSKSRDYFLRKTSRQVDLDKSTLAETNLQRNRFLIICVENYLKALIKTEKRVEHSVSRLVSLWFSNHQSDEVNGHVRKQYPQIKSVTFLPLMYQLCARLSSLDPTSVNMFSKTLESLVEIVVLDYPYHTIGYLVALKNVSRGKVKTSPHAAAFLKRLLKHNELKTIIMGFDSSFSAYIGAASQEISKKGSKVINGKRLYYLEANSTILGLKSHQLIPVLSCEFPVSRPKDHSEIVFVEKIERHYHLPGGINAPKVLDCLGNDGVIYKQLVKSKGMVRICPFV